MKNLILFCIFVIALFCTQQAVCTHLETCDCHEIRSLVNASVEKAIERLENNFISKIQSAIANTSTKIDIDDQFLETVVDKVEDSLTSILKTNLKSIQQHLEYHLPLPPLGHSEDSPGDSCHSIYEAYDNVPSGHYWIKSASGSPEEVYCQMEASHVCSNATGGWMRVAYINMSDPSHECPSGFSCTVRNADPTRLCDMTSNGYCIGTKFSAHGLTYSYVYGRVIAYQKGSPRAFSSSYNPYGIDGAYLYGVSLTHGQNPRQHVWSFAGAPDESSSSSSYKCPCMSYYSSSYVPSYVGDDHFCDSATSYNYGYSSSYIHGGDPLWDGEGCSRSSCCSVSNLCNNESPPWFIKELKSATADDIELRLCRPGYYGSTPIELIELYVK